MLEKMDLAKKLIDVSYPLLFLSKSLHLSTGPLEYNQRGNL
jgi:hypothetical protein